ncbi:MAG TPA: hypothetical protein PK771_05985 [Spirochaetota bacterium]|nr:hypothetical protein [Spirochaetota bacterium]
MNIGNINIYNMYNAVFGIRNNYSNWDLSDSNDNFYLLKDKETVYYDYCHIGEKDLKLVLMLCKKRSSERKFLRQIFVSMDITASLSFWKQLDTYKVGTVANSTSIMHTLGKRLLTQNDFENPIDEFHLDFLNRNIEGWQKTKDKSFWEVVENNLPVSFLQSRLWTANYEVLLNIYLDRNNHKKAEWLYFCEIIKNLELLKQIIEEVEK